MLQLTICLLLIGGLLLIAELFIPGFGVCGILGGIIVAFGFLTYITTPLGLPVVIAEMVLMVFTLLAAFRYIRRKQLHGKLILDYTLEPEVKDFDSESFLGKEGVAKTVLKPYGTAQFNGVVVGVYAQDALIPVGKKVKVVSVDGHRLLVRSLDN